MGKKNSQPDPSDEFGFGNSTADDEFSKVNADKLPEEDPDDGDDDSEDEDLLETGEVDDEDDTDNSTDDDDEEELIAGRYKTVDEMTLAHGQLEEKVRQLEAASQTPPQTQQQEDARTAAYQQAQQEIQGLIKGLGEDISPEASEKISRLMQLSNELAIAPLAENLYHDRNAREYEQVQARFKNHKELEPAVQRIIAENRARNLMDAFKLANYESLEKVAQGQAEDAEKKLEGEKKKAFSKSGGRKRTAGQQADLGAAIIQKLKAGKSPTGLEKEASTLGF